MLALDTADQGKDVVILEGVAELVDRPAAEVMPSGFGAKYAALFARLGSDPAAMAPATRNRSASGRRGSSPGERTSAVCR